MKTRKNFGSDMSGEQWEQVKNLIPRSKPGGRPRKVDTREIMNAIFYLNKTGCPWRYLPTEFPAWETMYTYFRDWRKSGVWKKINNRLRIYLRKRAGKASQATVGIIDSQSVKTSSVGGTRGYDGGKKVNGRKRHILVDTMGLLMVVVVHAANVQDRDGGLLVLEKIQKMFTRLKIIWADGGYRGSFIEKAKIFFQRKIKVVMRTDNDEGFRLVPKRWIVERTFSWISNFRRNSKDYERLPETSEAFIYISMGSVQSFVSLV